MWPGLFATEAFFFPTNELMSVDLPTLGIPTIKARVAGTCNPSLWYFSCLEDFIVDKKSVSSLISFLFLKSKAFTYLPCDMSDLVISSNF